MRCSRPGFCRCAGLMSADYDLNLLVALDALLTEGSVTGAAKRLHLSVPAMSRTLSRLRREFHDPLLVKAGRGLVPTDRALALRDRVRNLLEEANALAAEEAPLDPSTLRRDFLIVAGEAILVFLAGPLLAYLEEYAPQVRCAFLAEGPELPMRNSEVDIAIGASRPHECEVRVETLMVDELVGVCRPGHPILDGPMTPERYLQARHLGNSRRGRLRGPLEKELGINRRVMASAPIVSSLSILLSVDLIGLSYRTLEGSMVAALGLATFEIPYVVRPLPIAAAWHPRHDDDLAHAWLRRTIRTVFAETLALQDKAFLRVNQK